MFEEKTAEGVDDNAKSPIPDTSMPHFSDDSSVARQICFNSDICLMSESRPINRLTADHISVDFIVYENEILPYGQTDLISGVYEGGYKLWEGSVDLVNFIVKQRNLLLDVVRAVNKAQNSVGCIGSVLELGCGHGLPGIVAYKLLDNPRLLLSDFNQDVLEQVTWPNIKLNINVGEFDTIECWAGDWLDLSQHLISRPNDQGKFAVILSAETLYNIQACEKVFQMILHHLLPGGIAVIATKRYYFGVGGGSSDLEEMVSKNSCLSWKLEQSIEDGISNIRDVITIRKSY